jgi:spore germination protein GerM
MAPSTRSPDPVALTPDTCRAHPCRQHLSHPGRWSAVLVPALAALSLLLAACSQSAPATSAAPADAGRHPSTAAQTGTSSGSPVKVYFSKHPESDSTPTAVFAVTRVTPNTQVATYAIQQLIAGPTAAESAAGYYTTLGGWLPGASNCGGPDFILTLNRKGTTPQPGTATLQFCRTVLLGGDLSGVRISAEIEATLVQFATIHQVVILTPQGTCFDDFSGQNACLGYPVRVYFSKHPDSDHTLSAVFPVSRVSPDLGVATFAITQLIAGPTPAERADGYFSAFDGVPLRGASVCGGPAFTIRLDTRGTRREAGTATLMFCTSFSFQGNFPMWQRSIAEITTTLLQFPTIQRVVLLTDRDTCYADQSDGTGCLT